MVERLVIDAIRPTTPDGLPAKGAIGERVTISAAAYRDGHDLLLARVRWRHVGADVWQHHTMQAGYNDRWEAVIEPTEVGRHEFVVEAWTDRYGTWAHDVEVKAGAGQDIELELEEGAQIIELLAGELPREDEHRPVLSAAVSGLRDSTRSRDSRMNAGLDDYVHRLLRDHPRSSVEARSRLPPRCGSTGPSPGAVRGTSSSRGRRAGFPAPANGCRPWPTWASTSCTCRRSTRSATRSARAATTRSIAQPGDPGSPWAIGAEEGGHTAVHPDLGTIDDFDAFVAEAERLGLEVALDYALQCSPDHPWVTEHPEWFHHRPDGTIKYAENPPKKYQDIYPINFWPDKEADRVALWEECKAILDHWIAHGVTIFRVDNPHTKPFAFWDVAHPRGAGRASRTSSSWPRPSPDPRSWPAWPRSVSPRATRTSRGGPPAGSSSEYGNELAHTELADYMRPNFWPNTPDILSGPLRHGPPAAFKLRLVLAATMVPNYGIYSGYELFENEPASDSNEEYLYSEKYEIKRRDWDVAWSLAPYITRVNAIRHRHPSLAELRTLTLPPLDQRSDHRVLEDRRRRPRPGPGRRQPRPLPDPRVDAVARPQRPRHPVGPSLHRPRRAQRRHLHLGQPEPVRQAVAGRAGPHPEPAPLPDATTRKQLLGEPAVAGRGCPIGNERRAGRRPAPDARRQVRREAQ